MIQSETYYSVTPTDKSCNIMKLQEMKMAKFGKWQEMFVR